MTRPWNFAFFVIIVYNEKLGHMLKPLVPKYRSSLTVRLRDIAEKKTGPREAETDSKYVTQISSVM